MPRKLQVKYEGLCTDSHVTFYRTPKLPMPMVIVFHMYVYSRRLSLRVTWVVQDPLDQPLVDIRVSSTPASRVERLVRPGHTMQPCLRPGSGLWVNCLAAKLLMVVLYIFGGFSIRAVQV
jgi:hypothetical protein